MAFQYKSNFGIYLDADFLSVSPKGGSIRKLALVLYRDNSKDNKYLFEFISFMQESESSIDTISVIEPSPDWLPMFIPPWQRVSKLMNFIYNSKEQFPIAPGTYICELLIWIENDEQADYMREIRFEMSSDHVDLYKGRRDKQSTWLNPLYVTGYTPVISRKLSPEEYRILIP